MNEEIDKDICFFCNRLKKLREWMEEHYTAEYHNEFYEVVDILKDLYEIKKIAAISAVK